MPKNQNFPCAAERALRDFLNARADEANADGLLTDADNEPLTAAREAAEARLMPFLDKHTETGFFQAGNLRINVAKPEPNPTLNTFAHIAKSNDYLLNNMGNGGCCGCCGRETEQPQHVFCDGCKPHIAPDAPGIRIHNRTYYGQHGTDCPFQVKKD